MLASMKAATNKEVRARSASTTMAAAAAAAAATELPSLTA